MALLLGRPASAPVVRRYARGPCGAGDRRESASSVSSARWAFPAIPESSGYCFPPSGEVSGYRLSNEPLSLSGEVNSSLREVPLGDPPCYDRATSAPGTGGSFSADDRSSTRLLSRSSPVKARMASYLFVCSGGGHLKEMFALSGLLGVDPEEQHWATVDSALSRTLLADRRVTHLADPPPRAVVPVLRNAMIGRSLLARGSFDAVFSTGASPALSFLPLAASRGIPAHYIESAARVLGPSMTGRILARVPAVSTYTQYRSWADDRWSFGGSIFDTYRVEDVVPQPIRRAVVSVGTQDGYPFPRFFAALAPLLEGVEVLWQTGANDVSGLGIDGRHSVPHDELNAAMKAADVVIAHGGVGTALSAIEQGRVPILVPRRASFGEHVDDHQVQIATRLADSGLAVTVDIEGLSRETLELAAARRVVSADSAVPFVVHETAEKSSGLSRRLFPSSR
ncbi:hypothetical protein C5C30_06780 [Rathayibacter sp. AY2B5]|nr:hypothetical protein C5C30_06780 [Rathayibacter sp. AY2B5]